MAESGLSRIYARLHIKCYCFVHFFSGFRRKGDIHQVLQQVTLEKGVQVFVISVDICMQREQADLCSDHSTSFWVNRVKAGQILGAGGGPPCETYTAARHQPGGPPPLRSQDFPVGLPAMTAKKRCQTAVGTTLVRFLCEVLFWVGAMGGCGFFEHPQWPAWLAAARPASVWISAPLIMLSKLGCVSTVSFDQCVLGTPFRKPTTILLVRLHSFRQAVLNFGQNGRCCHQTHEALKGRQQDGSFATAKAKVYPASLNNLLGRAIADFISVQLGDLISEPLPDSLACFCEDSFADEEVVQPDFHG